jgi:hypothetical protein
MEDRSAPAGILTTCVKGFVSSTVVVTDTGFLGFKLAPIAELIQRTLAITETKAVLSVVIVILLMFSLTVGLSATPTFTLSQKESSVQ